jgi:spore coat polysaccharide biosynthesis protein SpsF
MKDMGGKPLLCRSLDRIHECKEIDEVVVATSDLDRDDAIAELCQSLGVACFRGDETDVLQRIADAGKSAEAEVIQRVCGEDPLLDPASIDAGIRIHLENKYDLTTNVRLGDYPDDWPYIDGFDVEVVNAAALQLLCDADLTERHKEHVTLYIRENPQEFSVHEIEPDPSFRLVPPRSFSVDTPEDLEFLRRVYQTFSGVGFIDSREVVDRVRQGTLS